MTFTFPLDTPAVRAVAMAEARPRQASLPEPGLLAPTLMRGEGP